MLYAPVSRTPSWVSLVADISTHWFRSHHQVSDELSDTAIPCNKTWPRPRLHLLVDGRYNDPGLCRTLLTAVVQGYPPPVLVGYREGIAELMDDVGLYRAMLRVLSDYRQRIGREDVVMWLREGQWVQLPAEVTVRRYLQQKGVINRRLAQKHPDANIRQHILLPASKTCFYKQCNNTDPGNFPVSTLPPDIYGPMENKATEARYTRPHLILPGAFLGDARDVSSLLQASLETAGIDTKHFGGEASINRLFTQQEQARREHLRPPQTKLTELVSSIFNLVDKLTNFKHPSSLSQNTVNSTAFNLTTSELGLHLDYESRIFQPIDPSTTINDIRFLTFSRNHSLVLSNPPSKTASYLYLSPLSLPPELPTNSSPLSHININPSPPLGTPFYPPLFPDSQELFNNLSKLKKTVLWSTVSLATNIVVPRGSIPSVLDMRECDDTPEMVNEWWERLWFRPYARVLLQGYLRPDRRAVALDEYGEGEAGWWKWNDRGGRGGVWTDLGELMSFPLLFVFPRYRS